LTGSATAVTLKKAMSMVGQHVRVTTPALGVTAILMEDGG
jgi:hypothetical protein